jgi:hypothetical protein
MRVGEIGRAINFRKYLRPSKYSASLATYCKPLKKGSVTNRRELCFAGNNYGEKMGFIGI